MLEMAGTRRKKEAKKAKNLQLQILDVA